MNIKNGNIFSRQKEPVIFTSEHSHASMQKIGMMIGIGTENVLKIRADDNSKVDTDDLEFQIRTQISLGKEPFAIVATAGTTVSGNIDPLSEISNIASKYNLWLHIDAIYGGAVILSSAYRHLMNGTEKANSISFNPQKWLYIAKTCSMVLFKDFDEMIENFRISAPYMRDQNSYINLGEINVQGTKYAEVVKLWLSLLSLGKNGYEQLINYSFNLTDKFINEVAKRNYLKLVSQPELNLVCFRGELVYLNATEFDDWNEKLQKYLVEETNFFLSLPKYKNSLWLRAVLLNPFLTSTHIKDLFDHIDIFEEINRK